MQRILFILFLALASPLALAQEAVVGLYVNPQAKPQPSAAAGRPYPAAPPAPLPLPFIDDFSEKTPWPNPALWESKGVFVNTNYAIAPPTIGVATFDAKGDNGYIYPHIGPPPRGADSLTSHPINLSSESNVVLSFFYQPGGRGDLPEDADVLTVEFFSPSDGQWTTVWTASAHPGDTSIVETYPLLDAERSYKGSIDSIFRYAAVAVDEPRFLADGFRFRFTNLAGMQTSPIPDRESNCDYWHLDFVYLQHNRSLADTLLPDVAISEPQRPVTRTYTSIPAGHLKTNDARRYLFDDPMAFSLVYQNLGWGTRNITRRFSIMPLQGSYAAPQEYSGGTENIFDGQKFVRDYTYEPYEFWNIDPDADSVAYEIKSYLITDTDPSPLRAALRHNDTTACVLAFYNYYSYDDGTAEQGYGLVGTGTSNGKVAVRFTAYDTDSLRAISAYFNLARDSANARPFRMAVWADNNGTPGTELYNQRVAAPTFSDEMNRFVTYRLPEAIEIKRGQVFYVGWIQQAENYLNIGYDLNSANHGATTLYNIGGTWQPSVYGGTLMLRPVFGRASGIPDDAVPLPTPPPPSYGANTWVLYPNPVYDVLNVRAVGGDGEWRLPTPCRVEIYNTGLQRLQSTVTDNGSVSVAGLPQGLYVVRIFENNRLVATREILKVW